MSYSHWNDQILKLPALHQAARRGNLAQVKKLLKGKGKAKVNEAGEFGDTPTMWAAHEGNASVVAYLIATGANVNVADKEKTTPLHLAAMGGHCEIIATLLVKGANAKAMDGDGLVALHFAAGMDCPDAIQLFTQSKVNANMRSGIQGMTALHFAAHFGHPAAIRALIKAGADVNRVDEDKVTPLHMAAKNNRFISVGVLINNGADPNAKDGDGSTPLHLAAEGGYDDIVKDLLDAGGKSNLLDKEGNTPLYYAQSDGHHGIAKMLIEGGKFATAKTPEGENIAERIFKKVSPAVVYIKAENEQGAKEGSGVIVGDNLIATNFHVIDIDGGEVVIEVHKAREATSGKMRIDVSDDSQALDAEFLGAYPYPAQDFCLLSVPGLEGEAVKIRSSHDLRVGEEVYAIGNPQGHDLTLSGGVISQIRDEGNCRMIQTNAAISEGSSGGGLFDKGGNLIGITTQFDKDGQNLNYAVAADLVWGLLSGKR